MYYVRESYFCYQGFDFRGDGEKICPYHSPCLTESIIMCIYVLCDSHSHLSSRGGGGGEDTSFRQNWYLLFLDQEKNFFFYITLLLDIVCIVLGEVTC